MNQLPTLGGRRVVVAQLAASPDGVLAGGLNVEAQARPEPAADDVVIAVCSAAVGWVDVLMACGQYQHVPELPYTPGLEFAGEVVDVGATVTGCAIGDRVLVDPLLTGPRSLGDHRRWGGFATYAVAPARAVIAVPDGFAFDEAACLLGGAETACHALVHRARVRAGETVLVLGATGATGLAAVQLATLLGARVVAVGRSRAKLEIARELGASDVIAVEDGALPNACRALTGGRGVDVVVDAVGGELSVEALRACAFGARFVVVGWASTPLVARGGRAANQLPTHLILMKGIDVLGAPAAIAAHRDPVLRTARLGQVLGWAAAGHLRPHIGAVFGFDRLGEALRAKWDGGFAGNVIVRP